MHIPPSRLNHILPKPPTLSLLTYLWICTSTTQLLAQTTLLQKLPSATKEEKIQILLQLYRNQKKLTPKEILQILPLLHDKNPIVQKTTTQLLAQPHILQNPSAPEQLLPALRKNLFSPHWQVRYWSLFALAQMKQKATSATYDILKAYDGFLFSLPQTPSLKLQEGRVPPTWKNTLAKKNISLTSKAILKKKKNYWLLLDRGLELHLQPNQQQIEVYQPTPDLQAMAIYTLSQTMGRPIFDPFLQLLQKHPPRLRQAALYSIGRVGKTALPALDGALQALSDPNPEVRAAAAYALGRIGASNSFVVHPLARALKDEDPQVQLAAAQALEQLPYPGSDLVLENLILTLQNPQPNIQAQAIRALAALKTSAQNALSTLLSLAKNKNPQIREALCYALPQIDPLNPNSLSTLLSLSQDPSPSVRAEAALALAKMKIKKTNIRQHLLKLQQDPHPFVRQSAIEAIKKLN